MPDYCFDKPFGYWWQMYQKKVGNGDEFHDFEQLFYDPKHGFMTWSISPDGKTLTIHKGVGNGKHWRRVVYDMFRLGKAKYGLKRIRLCTIRSPKAFARMFGGEIVGSEVRNGRTIYWLETTEAM